MLRIGVARKITISLFETCIYFSQPERWKPFNSSDRWLILVLVKFSANILLHTYVNIKKNIIDLLILLYNITKIYIVKYIYFMFCKLLWYKIVMLEKDDDEKVMYTKLLLTKYN